MAPTLLFSWIHLSDIHAGHGNPTVQEDQQVVLDELVLDVQREAPKLGGVNAIVITGDVAARGNAAEYASAKTLLKQLTSVTGVAPTSIFVVPGNHDVDRGVARRHAQLSLPFDAVRRGEGDLNTLLADEALRALLAERTKSYRQFVADVAPCSQPTLPGCAAWEHERPLADNLLLRLVGLDTALLSQDDNDCGRLHIGSAQARLVTGDPARDALRITLAHHPLEWLADPEDVRNRIDQRSDVLLHGHVHQQHGRMILEGGGDRSLRIVAGAAHGDQDEKPRHGYQIASLVRDDSGRINLRVWPRVFEKGRFVTQGDYAQGVEGYAQFGLREIKRAAPPRPAVAAGGVAGRRSSPRPATFMAGAVPPFVPPLEVYVVWHPASAEGPQVARALFEILHGGGKQEGVGVPTFYRSCPAPQARVPCAIPLNAAANTAIVTLIDQSLHDDDDWRDWLLDLADACQGSDGARLYPVWLDQAASHVTELNQAIRAHEVEPAERESFVVHRVLHALWRHLRRETASQDASPSPVKVFLSHAKIDGEPIATDIKAFLRDDRRQLATWYDRRDIADGYAFAQEIASGVADPGTVFLSVHTDAYWERPWCVAEFLTALEKGRPIIVVDASSFSGQRHDSWLGRAPVLRWQGLGTQPFFRSLLRTLLVEGLRFEFLPRYLDAVARAFGMAEGTAVRPTPPTSFDILRQQTAKRILYPDPLLPPHERDVLARLARERGITLHTPATLLVTP